MRPAWLLLCSQIRPLLCLSSTLDQSYGPDLAHGQTQYYSSGPQGKKPGPHWIKSLLVRWQI